MDETCPESTQRFRNLLRRAKIDENQLKNDIQHLCYSAPVLSTGEFRLLQVDETILHELEAGEELVIRGDASDTAVICTKDKSYALKESETSNSILLAPECLFSNYTSGDSTSEMKISDVQVISLHHKTMEMVEEKWPNMEKLRRLLDENPYSGPQNEQSGKPRYRLYDFLERIPASEKHILDVLSGMPILEIEGFYRKLDFDYITRIYTEVNQCLDENAWSWTSLDKDRVVEHLVTEFNEPAAVVEAFFRWFAYENMTDHKWAFDERKICRLCAEMLLKPTKKFNANDFFSLWPKAVPYGMAEFAVQEQLSGLAIMRRENGPAYVQYLPKDELPDGLEERLVALFRVKQKWLLEELEAYVISADNGNSTADLMKYCRVSTGADGKKWYSSKYGVP